MASPRVARGAPRQMVGIGWRRASEHIALGSSEDGGEKIGIHLRRLFGEEDSINLGKVRSHNHLRLHLFRRFVENRFPERCQQLVWRIDAGFHYRPYFTAKNFCSDIWIPRIDQWRCPWGRVPEIRLTWTDLAPLRLQSDQSHTPEVFSGRLHAESSRWAAYSATCIPVVDRLRLELPLMKHRPCRVDCRWRMCCEIRIYSRIEFILY